MPRQSMSGADAAASKGAGISPIQHDDDGDGGGFGGRVSTMFQAIPGLLTSLLGSTPAKEVGDGGGVFSFSRSNTPAPVEITYASSRSRPAAAAAAAYAYDEPADDMDMDDDIDAGPEGASPSSMQPHRGTPSSSNHKFQRQWTHTFADGSSEPRLHRRSAEGEGDVDYNEDKVEEEMESGNEDDGGDDPAPIGSGVGIPVGHAAAASRRAAGNRRGGEGGSASAAAAQASAPAVAPAVARATTVDRSKLRHQGTYVKNMNRVRLKASLKSLGLDVEGKKAELKERLENALILLMEDPYINSPAKQKTAAPTAGALAIPKSTSLSSSSSSSSSSSTNAVGRGRKRKAARESSDDDDRDAVAEGEGDEQAAQLRPIRRSTRVASKNKGAQRKKASPKMSTSRPTRKRSKKQDSEVEKEDKEPSARSKRSRTNRNARGTRSSARLAGQGPAPAAVAKAPSRLRSGRKFRKSPGANPVPAAAASAANAASSSSPLSSSRSTRATRARRSTRSSARSISVAAANELPSAIRVSTRRAVSGTGNRSKQRPNCAVQDEDDEDYEDADAQEADHHEDHDNEDDNNDGSTPEPAVMVIPDNSTAANLAAIDAAVQAAVQAKLARFEAEHLRKEEEARATAQRQQQKEAAERRKLEAENRKLQTQLAEQAFAREHQERLRASERHEQAERQARERQAGEEQRLRQEEAGAAQDEASARAAAEARAADAAQAEATSSSSFPSSSNKLVRPKPRYAQSWAVPDASAIVPKYPAKSKEVMTNSVPFVRKLMGISRDPHRYEDPDNEDPTDGRIPRGDSAFGPVKKYVILCALCFASSLGPAIHAHSHHPPRPLFTHHFFTVTLTKTYTTHLKHAQ